MKILDSVAYGVLGSRFWEDGEILLGGVGQHGTIYMEKS